MPRSGVPVAFEVARRLGAPLDIVGVHTLGAPLQPTVAIGAIGEERVRVLDRGLLKRLSVASSWLDAETKRATCALREELQWMRNGLPRQPIRGHPVILVDDGSAGGLTTHAAVEVLRRRGATHIVLAMPVAAASVLRSLSSHLGEVVCLEQVSSLGPVGRRYRDFRPVRANKVRRLLAVAAGLQPDIVCEIGLGGVGDRLMGNLAVPVGAGGLVIFASGQSGGRRSPDSRVIATQLGDAGFGTLLVDLLTEWESAQHNTSLDVRLLADRLITVTRWASAQPELSQLPVGYLAAGAAAAAALMAAAEASLAGAIVSCGGRPNLAAGWLPQVSTPTLLIVGAQDTALHRQNVQARKALHGPVVLETVPGSTQRFDQPATLDRVADLAATWFVQHLSPFAAAG